MDPEVKAAWIAALMVGEFDMSNHQPAEGASIFAYTFADLEGEDDE